MMWKTAATAASGVSEAEQHRDQAEMADGRVGQQRLQVVLEQGDAGAEQRACTRPVVATSQNHSSVPDSTGQSRASRNTPAFTMVAECR